MNTSVYARRQHGPGQRLDRFPASPSPCCRRSRRCMPLSRCQEVSGAGAQDRAAAP